MVFLQKDCNVCEKRFYDEGVYLSHFQSHRHTRPRLGCFYCSATFQGEKEYRQHRERDTCRTRVAPQATVKSPPNDPVGPPILQAGQPSQGHWKCPHCSFVEECQEPLTEASFDRIRKHLDQHARRKDCPSVKCPVCAKSFCSAQHSNFGNHQRGHKVTGDYTKLHLDTTGSRDVDAQAPGNEVNDVNEVNEVSFSISISFSIFRPGGFFSRFSLNSRHFKLKKLAKLKDFS